MRTRSPWWFVPTAYLVQGLPYFLVTETSVVLFKRLGMENDAVAWWTSLLAWPWALKLLIAPLVEVLGTRRRWVLACQAAMAVVTVGLAAGLASWPVAVALLTMMACLSATHDVALDGYYVLALDRDAQAAMSGVRSTAFKLARVVAAGLVVALAGALEGSARFADPVRGAWAAALLVVAAVLGAALLWNVWFLSASAADVPRASDAGSVWDAATALLRRPGIGWVLLFLVTYRLPEQLVTKMASPFLLDPRAAGGLGLDTAQVGLLTGTLGVACIVVGGLGGGFAIARWGLRRCIWPMVVVMHAPNLLYLAAARVQPGVAGAALTVGVEQLGYGLGFSAFTVVLLRVAEGSGAPTSAYALATGVMAVGGFVAGASSGWLQVHVGYSLFFTIAVALAVPAAVPVRFALRALDAQDGE
jgi:PAT family beta-lactamase induction signal transducer AmpG